MKTLLLICSIILFASIYANAQNSATDSITISSKQLEKLNDENTMLQQQLLDLQNELIQLGVRKTITFKYNGKWVTYGVVSYWNRYWMDRNLGAKQVATSIYDTLSIGDFYQWGRATDGHQLLTNNKVSYTRAKADQQPGNDSIIELNTNVGTWDWNANSNWTTRWEDGSHKLKISTNVCPDGWHVPTMPEWATASLNWTTYKSGFESTLKLSLYNGWTPNDNIHPLDTPFGGYWTNTTGDNSKGSAWYLFLCENNPPRFWKIQRNSRCQIRCIKDK